MKKLRRNQYISRSTKDSFFVDEKKKRPIIPLIIVGVILAAVFAFFIYGLRYGGKVVIARATVESSQLPKSFDGYKILQISDVYGKEFGERQKKLRDMLKDEDYDIVIFTGDYMGNDTDPDFWVIRDIIEGLKEDEWKMCIVPPRKLEIMSLFEEYGGMFVYPAQIVTNASGDSIYLTGISYDREALNAMDFDQDVDFSICVTHKPINYNVSRRLKDVNKRTLTEVDYDLSLSGHTFGGQYRLPVLGAIFSDEEGWFPQEKSLRGISRDDAGRYNYICGGLGVASGVRFFSNPEISIIELKYAEPAKK